MTNARNILVRFILFLAMATMCKSKLDNMGSCRANIATDCTMDFDEYMVENNGLWHFQMVPMNEFSENLEKMYLVNKPSDLPGTYQVTIYYQKKGEEVKVFAEETVEGFSKGKVTATSSDEQGAEIQFTIYFMKYVPGRYICYYICSDIGGDEDTDYRYVLSNENLTYEEIVDINNLDDTYQFKSTLKRINI